MVTRDVFSRSATPPEPTTGEGLQLSQTFLDPHIDPYSRTQSNRILYGDQTRWSLLTGSTRRPALEDMMTL